MKILNNITSYVLFAFIVTLFYACESENNLDIAYGNFEVEEWQISSELPGKLILYNISEGLKVHIGDVIGAVDSSSLTLQKIQLKASIDAIRAKVQNANPQIELLKTKIKALQKEKLRLTILLQDSLANQKQMDDLLSQEDILNAQIKSVADNISIVNHGILAQVKPLKAQLAILNNSIAKCQIKSPINGTVSLSLAQRGENIGPGMLLCKIASMDTLILRAFITGNQLSLIKLNQKVQVQIDDGKGGKSIYRGVVSWISDRAEFTPKIIQTAEDRVNLVYAVKIDVANDGYLKSGMPGELHFNTNNEKKEQ